MSATQVRERHNPAGLTPAARRFLAANPELETPFLVFDMDVVEVRYRQLIAAMPVTRVPVEGHFTDWTPLSDRSPLFPDDIDDSDPWQFRNVLVH